MAEIEEEGSLMKKKVFLQLAVVTLLMLVAIRLLKMWNPAWLKGYLQFIVAIILIYVPVVLNWLGKSKVVLFESNIGEFRKSIFSFLAFALVVFPLFLVVAHFWQLYVFKLGNFFVVGMPDFTNIFLYQLLLVAFPEEVFFRGYFQTMLNGVLKRRWKILGVELGWSWILTAFVFAFAHSFIEYQWWHFAIFFPALVFGFLRERTKSLTAPVLFHGASNILMIWFSRCYY